MAKNKKRGLTVPLTKQQLESEAGQALLALVQSITGDGLVSASEATRLHRWLHRYANEKLPAIAFLNAELDQLRLDEKAGDTWPRRRLHRALERVLPKALRDQAKDKRRRIEALEFNWNPRPDDPPARVSAPVMSRGVPTLLCPTPSVPNRRLREVVIPRRIEQGLMAATDQFRALPDPPSTKQTLAGGKKSSQKAPRELVELDFKRNENAPTPDPFAWIHPQDSVFARSRYRGELMWFEGKAWNVFCDPEDSDCRYAQPVA